MNRNNYDKRTVQVIEIIGAYFTDIFYNHLYVKAVERSRECDKSVTDLYKSNISAYMFGIKKPERCKQVIMSLHEYYRTVTKFASVTLKDFEDTVLSQFIPAEYYGDFNEKQKDAALANIVSRTSTDFGNYILRPENIRRFVDGHSNKVNVAQLQDSIFDILIFQRDEYYAGFSRKQNQRGEKVDVAVLEKLKAALVEETKRRCSAEEDRDRAINIVRGLTIKMKELESELAGLRALPLNPPARQAAAPQPKTESRNDPKNDPKTESEDAKSAAKRKHSRKKKQVEPEPEPEIKSEPAIDPMDDLRERQRKELEKRRAQRQAEVKVELPPKNESKADLKADLKEDSEEENKDDESDSDSAGASDFNFNDDPGFGTN